MRALPVAVAVALAVSSARGWDVRCEHDGIECTDPYDRAQTTWRAHPRSEHRAILERSLEISGLPSELQAPFDLTVFTSGEVISATVLVDKTPKTFTHESIRPLRVDANRIRTRETTIQAMATLPDFSYTLWDWAAGNELCPPEAGTDAVDCHNYETHIGWLNSNHMLPQSRRFYEHFHRLALDRAAQCRAAHDEIPEDQRERFRPYLLACEKEALVIEGVGHHYLQDSWSSGHMWERWGGPEIADFGGDRTLGFAVGGFVGSIHGSKAVLDEDPLTAPLAPWDDPLCAPHIDVVYVDPPATLPKQGGGDVFLQSHVFDATNPFLTDQRRAMLGCAVDGLRAVYAETAQVHGAMEAADAGQLDASRAVTSESCWGQRVTNKAFSTGCGVHRGGTPGQLPAIPGFVGTLVVWALGEAQARGLPPLTPAKQLAFQRDAAYTCTLASALAAVNPDGTTMASGGAPAIAGVQPNSFYAKGGAADPSSLPASYADPFLPWNLDETDDTLKPRKEALALVFADAHAADRCSELDLINLDAQKASVGRAQDDGDSVVIEARCTQCALVTAPHLRFGVEGNHDARREALCAFVAPDPVAFVYTGEDPNAFTGDEPTDAASIEAAARVTCGCETTTTTSTTTTTLPQGTNCDPEDFVDRTDAAADRTVSYASFAVSPRCITIKAGQSITFAAGATGHSVVGTRVGGGQGFTSNVSAGGTAERLFASAAVFDTQCGVHPSETGGIQVVP
jgi:plastocyanin